MTASLPPDLEIDDYILARDPDTKTGFRLHTVLSIDTANDTVRVYPWVSNVVAPGEQMGWVWGMNVDISHSNDTNSLQVKEARAFVTGGNVRVDTTVGTTADHVYSQASAANIIVGKGLPNSFVGFTEFKAAQHEGGIGVVLNSISSELAKVSGEVSADEVQIGYAPRNTADKILAAVSGTQGKIILVGNEGIRQPTGTMPGEASFGTQVFRLNSARKHVVYNRSSGTVILEWDFHENEKFGAQQTWLTWLATKNRASAMPAGTLTLRPGVADLADGWEIGSEATGYGTHMTIAATGTEPPVILATARAETKRYHIKVL